MPSRLDQPTNLNPCFAPSPEQLKRKGLIEISDADDERQHLAVEVVYDYAWGVYYCHVYVLDKITITPVDLNEDVKEGVGLIVGGSVIVESLNFV